LYQLSRGRRWGRCYLFLAFTSDCGTSTFRANIYGWANECGNGDKKISISTAEGNSSALCSFQGEFSEKREKCTGSIKYIICSTNET